MTNRRRGRRRRKRITDEDSPVLTQRTNETRPHRGATHNQKDTVLGAIGSEEEEWENEGGEGGGEEGE
eukprot:1889139-Pyramimonas_sp.AAC.1